MQNLHSTKTLFLIMVAAGIEETSIIQLDKENDKNGRSEEVSEGFK
jgi:hypothetical protein